MKHISLLLAIPALLTVASCNGRGNQQESETAAAEEAGRVVVGYVTSWSDKMPDPLLVTHLNYAFGHVSESFDSMRIDNPERLQRIVALKEQNPELKVMVSVGGWGSGRFSEMAASESNRRSFATHCREAVEKYGLDGIDIDWEYPTCDWAGISASPDDTRNFTLLMRDLRETLGAERLLSMATIAQAQFIDFRDVEPYVDFVNVMSYDMARAPKHHSPLFASSNAEFTTSRAVQAHLDAGIPEIKLVMGIPFYGRGTSEYGNYCDYGSISVDESKYVECWDEAAQVPYIADMKGSLVLGYENEKSVGIKCDYALEMGLRGVMYWDCAGDDDSFSLGRTVARRILSRRRR